MRYQTEDVLETLRRMQRFLDDNDTTLGAVNHSRARLRLDERVAQIEAHAIAQVAGRRTSEGETEKQRSLRLALRFDHMRPIAVIAGEKLREQPEFKLLRLPRWKVRGPALTAAARDMANAAEQYLDLFVDEGLPPEFVAELRRAVDRLDESIDLRGQSRGQRAGATAGLKAETKRARALIRVLDSLVRPKLGTNDELLREWQVACHIRRARKAQSTTSAVETGPPAAATAGPTLALVPANASTEAAA